MPKITTTRADRLATRSRTQLLDIIRELNNNGHAITTTGTKPLLIQRILTAENPTSTQLTQPSLSTTTITQIETQTTLALTVNVISESTKSYAAQVLHGLRLLSKEIHLTLDPNTEAWRSQVASAKRGQKIAQQLEDKFLAPVTSAMGAIKSSIGGYELEQNELHELEKRDIERNVTSIAEELLLERIVELDNEGDYVGATKLEQAIESGSLARATQIAVRATPVVELVKVPGVSTRLVYKYEVLDIGKLATGFYKTIPDHVAIREAVKLHGDRATKTVGDGAIKVWREADTRSTGR